jgi:hypothetical protein
MVLLVAIECATIAAVRLPWGDNSATLAVCKAYAPLGFDFVIASDVTYDLFPSVISCDTTVSLCYIVMHTNDNWYIMTVIHLRHYNPW